MKADSEDQPLALGTAEFPMHIKASENQSTPHKRSNPLEAWSPCASDCWCKSKEVLREQIRLSRAEIASENQSTCPTDPICRSCGSDAKELSTLREQVRSLTEALPVFLEAIKTQYEEHLAYLDKRKQGETMTDTDLDQWTIFWREWIAKAEDILRQVAGKE